MKLCNLLIMNMFPGADVLDRVLILRETTKLKA